MSSLGSMLWFTLAVYSVIGVCVAGYIIGVHRFNPDPEEQKDRRERPK